MQVNLCWIVCNGRFRAGQAFIRTLPTSKEVLVVTSQYRKHTVWVRWSEGTALNAKVLKLNPRFARPQLRHLVWLYDVIFCPPAPPSKLIQRLHTWSHQRKRLQVVNSSYCRRQCNKCNHNSSILYLFIIINGSECVHNASPARVLEKGRCQLTVTFPNEVVGEFLYIRRSWGRFRF